MVTLGREHWESVYERRQPDQHGWYQAEPKTSLELVCSVASPGASVVDVGGGASLLVDRLLDLGFADVVVVDLAEAALAAVRRRLAPREVATARADVRDWRPGRTFDVWHDRAVFHFLTDAADREAYAATLRAVLRPGGHAIVATFSLSGLDRCSGLPVVRYSPETLLDALGGTDLAIVERRELVHVTPGGVVQPYQFTVLRRSREAECAS